LKTIIGSLDDHDVLEQAASEADIIFQSADSDHLPSTHAILRGMKKRFEDIKTPPVLIHTSGTAVLADDAMGMFASENIYSDLDITKIETLPTTQIHREIDLATVEAGKEGYVRTYIVLPGVIWGIASNVLTEMGLQVQFCKLLPTLIPMILGRGKAFIVGEGINLWPHVEINEAADFYEILFDAIISGSNPTHGREGFYILESGEYESRQISHAVGKSLFKAGKIDSDKLVPLTAEELEKDFMARITSANTRARGDRSRSLGWKPSKTTEDFIGGIDAEIQILVKKNLV